MIKYTPTPDYYNDYICHYNHNHDPKNGQFTTGSGGGTSSTKNIKKEYDKISNIKNDSGTLSADIDRGKGRSKLSGYVNTDSGLGEKDLIDTAKKILTNEKKIEKLAKQALTEGSGSYIYELFGEPNGLTKQQFVDKLEIKAFNVYDKKWPVEIELYEKDDKSTLLQYHMLSAEFDLDNLKKPKYVSMNG